MFYITKPVVFVIEDGDIANEIKRLSKDEYAFSNYISELVEKDLGIKLGKSLGKTNLLEPGGTSVTGETSIIKYNSVSVNEPYAEILSKLDEILLRSNQQSVVNPSKTFIEPAKNVSMAVDVEHKDIQTEPIPSIEPAIEKTISKKKKKGKLSLGGKDANSLLSKMKSMQK